MGIDLSVDFGKFKIKNPIISASGTFGYNNEFDVFEDVKNLGAIVTKGLTLEPRFGNSGERLFEVENGLINRIGLENVGIEKFLSDKKPTLEKNNIEYILNIAGSSIEDYKKLAKTCEDNGIKALEVNVSCPNVKSGCLEFGVNPNVLSKLVKAIRESFSGFLIIKLTPNTADIESLAKVCENEGADCISAINTLKALGVRVEFQNGNFKNTFVQGGLGGRCVKPIALSMVNRISKVVSIPIIGIGGISSLNDVFEFLSVGASAIQIGTENFTTPNICEKIVLELTSFMEKNNFKTFNELREKIYGK